MFDPKGPRVAPSKPRELGSVAPSQSRLIQGRLDTQQRQHLGGIR